MRRLVAAGALIGTLFVACAAPRQTLGTRSSPCFRSLPTAGAAIHDSGRLVGVRRVSRDTLLRAFPSAEPLPGREFCVVGYSGDFRNDRVDHPAGAPIGKYALVVVDMRGTIAHKTFLVDRVPFQLRHR